MTRPADTASPGYLDAIRAQFLGDPEEPVVLHEGRWLTYGEFGQAIEVVRARVVERSATGAAIGIEGANDPLALAGIVGVLLAGRCAVPLSPRRFDQEVGILQDQLGAVLDRNGKGDARTFGGVVEHLPTPLGELSLTVLDEDLGGDPDVALLLGTSGTTGEPRRIPILHRTIDAGIAALRVGNAGVARRQDVNVTCFPMYHLAGLIPSLLTLASGRQLALLEKFDAATVSDLVQEYEIRSLALTPTTIRMLLDADVDPAKLATLRFVRSGTAPLSVQLAQAFQDCYGVPAIQAYGQTEAGGEVIGWSPEDVRAHLRDKAGAVGRPRPGIEVRITEPGLAEPTEAVPAGTIGELWLRGVQGADRWQRSGDLASTDTDGFIWVHGRADDMILCGGFNIHPAQLEQVLEQHDGVLEAAVTGVDDDRLGQVPVAVVVTVNGVEEATLDAWCRANLEPYQCPRRYVRVGQLPRTDTGKVHRPSLEKLARA